MGRILDMEPEHPACFPRKFFLEDLLTNITIYCTTETIISSQHFKENMGQRHESTGMRGKPG